MSKRKSYIDKDGDALELDDQFFAEAVRMGRPPLPPDKRKQRVTLMLDPDVLARLKEGGRGWQTRLNTILREKLFAD